MAKIKCPHCNIELERTSAPSITCPNCGRKYKNPFYSESAAEQPAAPVENVAPAEGSAEAHEQPEAQEQIPAFVPAVLHSEAAGKKVTCPNCHTQFLTPAAAAMKCPNCNKAYKNPYYDNAVVAVNNEADSVPAPVPAPIQEPVFDTDETYFDGGAFRHLFTRLLNILQLIFTLGLGYVWTFCRVKRWEINHRVINGKRLVFTGKGSEMFGMWFGGIILSVLTLGLYAFKLMYKMDKYVVEHTFVVGEEGTPSVFSADLEGKVGLYAINYALTAVTLGIYATWATCRGYRWNFNHQTISSHKLVFDGKGIQLLGKSILWALLSLITIGIYGIFVPKKTQQWLVKHMAFVS